MTVLKNKPKMGLNLTELNQNTDAVDKATFYAISKHWLYDCYQSQTVWLRRSLFANIMLSVLLALSIIANVVMQPLKVNTPYLYTFNHATGEVTKLGRLEPSAITSNWQMTRFFIMHYVINRESYDSDNLNTPYQYAWANSNAVVKQEYDNEVATNLSHSPFKRYGTTKYITVEVLSVNSLNDNTAEVRFNQIIHQKSDGSQKIVPYEAIIKWQYTLPTNDQKQLDRDPLGFKVTYYRVTLVMLTSN